MMISGTISVFIGMLPEINTTDPYSASARANDSANPVSNAGVNVDRSTRGTIGNPPRVGPWREWHFEDWTPAPTRRAVVLDPFGGTGTTAMVAKALGRDGISVDLSADYCRLAEWRTNDRDELAKVLGISKAPAVDPDQLDLFTLEEGTE